MILIMFHMISQPYLLRPDKFFTKSAPVVYSIVVVFLIFVIFFSLCKKACKKVIRYDRDST